MNFVPVITHAVAILLGWLLVSFAILPDAGRRSADNSPVSKFPQAFRSSGSIHHPSPRSLLASQAEIPMDPAVRTALKRRILEDWAATDPDGLLRYLDQRPWMAGYDNAATRAFETMARTRPADLLAYAKREGCLKAIGILYQQGDPRVVLDLVRSLPSGTIPDPVLADVFERGCQLDPGFHERISMIENPETRIAVFKQSASTLLDARRDDEFYSWVTRNVDALPTGDLADSISRQLVRSRSDLNGMKRLPESIRPQTIDAALGFLASTHVYIDEKYQQDCLTAYLDNGWLDGRQDLAAAVITTYYQVAHGEDLRRAVAAGWKDWALDLPVDPKWDSLRRTAIRRWILETPDAWRAIADLPAKQLRSAAYAALVHKLDLEHDGERVPWILHQITDPALRNIALEVVTERMESSGDPFAAAGIDPFQPLGAR